jgi:glycosyltransferase involved in cell wall biosynthesis
MKQAAIIIPTTGNSKVEYAVESALKQTYKNTKVYLIIDGSEHSYKVDRTDWDLDLDYEQRDRLLIYELEENTGANGQNGHRIYSAMSFLSNADYLFYLDQDCWFDENHVESCIKLLETKDLDWVYSLRKIHSKSAGYLCNDDCESLGMYAPVFDYQLVDTNCYCIKREVAMMVAPYFVGGWGHDRRYLQVLATNFKKFDCTGKYTTNYRLGGDNNLTGAFWEAGNAKVEELYKDKEFPWRKNSEM